MLVTWALMIDSLGTRTMRLSKVRSFTDSRSMDRTNPLCPSMVMRSPTTKGRSASRNNPLMRLEAEVWEAKPRATVRMPAAPSNTLRLKPSWFRVAAKVTKARP